MKRLISLLLTILLLAACSVCGGITFNAAELDLVKTGEVGGDNFNPEAVSNRQRILNLEKDLPAQFDLRNFEGMNYVTPVKLQNPYGSCWAFAMAAAAEISYLYDNDLGVPAGEVNDQADFSEKYISWYMRHAPTAEDVREGSIPASQVGEGYIMDEFEKDNPNASYNIPGNPLYGVNFYASGFGPVYEEAEVDGEHPYVYAGKNRWRYSTTDEESAELAAKRKEAARIEYRQYIKDLIDMQEITSTDEYDDWFERNWKTGRKLYAFELKRSGYSVLDDWTLPLNAKYRDPVIEAYFKSSYVLPCPCTKDDEGNYLFDRAGVAAIKSELNKGRGVSIGILADQSHPNEQKNDKGYMNTTTWAQYYNDVIKMNHLVTIVGYDDNYAKENFTRKVDGVTVAGSTPPENGAFIVKNSWGSLTDEDRKNSHKNEYGDIVYDNPNADAWGINDTGYFYLSYYDHSIRTPVTFSFYDDDETEYFEVNYDQYDMMQDVDYKEITYTTEDDVRMANIFTASEDEFLYQISTMVINPMTTVRYQIYKDVKDTPDSGTLLESGSINKEYAGYQRIDLKTDYFLEKGTRYAVVIMQEVLDENNKVYMPVSMSLCENDKAGSQGTKIKSVINAGESFVNYGEGWKDLSTFKFDTEKMLADSIVQGWSQQTIDHYYPNGYEDFQIDNYPIKAFLVPMRTVTDRLLGNTNLDGSVDVTDATAIQRYDCGLMNLSQQALDLSDVDTDDEVSIIDATWIQRWDSELKAPEEIGKPVSRLDKKS